MADANNLNQFFVEDLPSLYHQAHRNLYSNDINVLEFYVRRLDDHIFVVQSVLYQCLHVQTADDDTDNLIDMLLKLYNLINSLREDMQQLVFMNTEYYSQFEFTCPIEEYPNPGRPRYHIPESVISGLFDIHRSWTAVAREAGVSYRTLLRRRHQYQLDVAHTSGPRNSFSELSQQDLCIAVREVLEILPNAGETYVIGALRSREIFVQRQRIRDAINELDPVSRAL